MMRTSNEQSPSLSLVKNLPFRQLSLQEIADTVSTSAVGSSN